MIVYLKKLKNTMKKIYLSWLVPTYIVLLCLLFYPSFLLCNQKLTLKTQAQTTYYLSYFKTPVVVCGQLTPQWSLLCRYSPSLN